MSRLKRHLEPEFRNLQAWRGKRFPGRPDDLQVRDFTHTCDLLGIPNWCPTPETPPPTGLPHPRGNRIRGHEGTAQWYRMCLPWTRSFSQSISPEVEKIKPSKVT